MSLTKAYYPIEKELGSVEALMRRMLLETAEPHMEKMGRMLLASPGKRLRPALVLLMAGNGTPHAIKTAAAFELIHMATLVHDDVMDANEERHLKPNLNKVFGNPMAIGAGDYVFAAAFALLSETKNPIVIGIAAKAIATVCEGQIAQLARRNLVFGMEESRAIIEKKTAALFEAACEAGAVLGKGDAEKARLFGYHFGVAFQLVDDYLDIVGTEALLGKKPGENLMEGEITIPVLMLLRRLPAGERNRMASRIFRREAFPQVRSMIKEGGIKSIVQKEVHQELMKAKQAAKHHNFRDSLLRLCSMLEARISLL